MHINILTVGKISNSNLSDQISAYEKRMRSSIDITWVYISHGDGDLKSSTQKESETILSKINSNEYVILLDEHGQIIDNQKLTSLLFDSNKDICIIIGGAYGVNEEVKNRADFVWSLSKLVFPHQIVRLVLAEQIYRSFAINSSHPYHHS